MRTSECVDKIAAALLAFQKEITPPVKNADNPYFKSKYADLCSLLAHCKLGMEKHGLVFISVGLESRIQHTSGQFIEGDFPCEVHGLSAQQVGSAFTYGRRYNFQGLLGINAEEDDDGAKATEPKAKAAVSNAKLNVVKVPSGQSKLHPTPPAPVEDDRVPASVTDSQVHAEPGEDREEAGITGEIVTLKALTKEKADKKGTLHRSLLLVFADGSEDWWYCSNKASMDLATKHKDEQVRARVEEKNGFKVCHELMAVGA